jgi:uncharacterized protein
LRRRPVEPAELGIVPSPAAPCGECRRHVLPVPPARQAELRQLPRAPPQPIATNEPVNLKVVEDRHRDQVAGCVAAGLVGTGLLAPTLRAPLSGHRFSLLSTGLGAAWLAGAGAAGSLEPSTLFGRNRAVTLRSVKSGFLGGAALVGVFGLGAVGAARVPFARRAIDSVVHNGEERATSATAVASAVLVGVAEELYFRGAVYDLVGGNRPLRRTASVYTSVTATTGNPMLVLAAAVLGAVCAAERERTGTIIAPVITHAVWSVGMLALLPRLVPHPDPRDNV